MNDEWTAAELLGGALSWRWPRSYRRVEERKDGTVAAFFEGTYRDGYHKSRRKTVYYELKIIFHPHEYGPGGPHFTQWRFGAMSFGGARLPKEYKDTIRQQYATILKNHQWPEEKENPYAKINS